MLRNNIRKIMRDAEDIRRMLEDMQERDYPYWCNQCQQNDVAQIIENLTHLECDISTMLSDCIFLGRRYWKDHNVPLIDSLHQSFVAMNTLCSDFKGIRLALGETHSIPSDFHQLIVDWDQLKKAIDQAQRLVQYSQKRRKNHTWFSAVRQSHGDQPGVESVNPLPSQDLLNQRNRTEKISEKYFG